MISDDDVNGKSTVNFGLQIEKLTNWNFEINKFANFFIYFDVLADGDGGGCGAGSVSIISHGQTLHVVADSNVVSNCFVGSLKIL